MPVPRTVSHRKVRRSITYKRGGKITTRRQAAQGVPAQGVPAQGVPAQGVPAQGVPAQGVPAQVPAQVAPLPNSPLEYFVLECSKNGISDIASITELIKNKHAFDNQHDFTADRGDFVPDAQFIYYINNLFNKSIEEVSSDIPIPGDIPGAIFARNIKFKNYGIRFADLEWDTFRYFSRMMSNSFSCTSDAGLTFEEIGVLDIITKEGRITDNYSKIIQKQHIVLNTIDWDPIEDDNKAAMLNLGKFYLDILGVNKGLPVYLNFDAKTKGTFTKPLRLYDGITHSPKVMQLITYQNLYDSGTNMFSNLSDDTKTFPRTQLITSADALTTITSNYFTSNLPEDRKYTMQYIPIQNFVDTPIGIQNIFNWVKMSVVKGGDAVELQTSPGTTDITNLPQRGGPGVGVLAKYIDTYSSKCITAAGKASCSKTLNVNIEQQKGFDTVRISHLLGNATNLSDVIKLCVDIKGGGDAEQVNAMWHLYHHKKIPCIMVTGDILCYMYSIIMGLPSVLIVGNKIYLSKGVETGEISPRQLLENKVKTELNIFTGIIKTYTDLADTAGKIQLLKTNILDGVKKDGLIKFGNQNPSPDIQETITYLIKLKALDIYNYLSILSDTISGIKGRIDPIIDKLTDLYGPKIYAIDIDLDSSKYTDNELEVFYNQIQTSKSVIKDQIKIINTVLDNFKNKKFDGSIKSFISGINSTIFFTPTSTIQEYPLFNYDRDKILKDFSEVLQKIKNEREATDPAKNPRFFLGKSIRGKFVAFFETFLTFKLIDTLQTPGYFTNLVVGYTQNNVYEASIYTYLKDIVDDTNIINKKNSSICGQLKPKLVEEINTVITEINSGKKVIGGGKKKKIGGNANIAILQQCFIDVIPTCIAAINMLLVKNAIGFKYITTPQIENTNEKSIPILESEAKTVILDTFREILQDAFIFSLTLPMEKLKDFLIDDKIDDLYNYIYISYEGIFDKLNSMFYNIKYIHEDIDYKLYDILEYPENITSIAKLQHLYLLNYIYRNALMNISPLETILETYTISLSVIDKELQIIENIGKLEAKNNAENELENEENELENEENELENEEQQKTKKIEYEVEYENEEGELAGGRRINRKKKTKKSNGERSLSSILKGLSLQDKKKKTAKRKSTRKNRK